MSAAAKRIKINDIRNKRSGDNERTKRDTWRTSGRRQLHRKQLAREPPNDPAILMLAAMTHLAKPDPAR